MVYVPLDMLRFEIAQKAQGEVLIIAAVRMMFVVLFLSFWLMGWTVGGVAAITALFRDFAPFLLFWLGGWALGWIAAASTLAWMVSGRQTLRVTGRDLEVGLSVFVVSWRKVFRGSDIRNLVVAPVTGWPARRGPQMPFGIKGGSCAVSSTYGARTRYLAAGLDQSEAEQIVTWLQARLQLGSP